MRDTMRSIPVKATNTDRASEASGRNPLANFSFTTLRPREALSMWRSGHSDNPAASTLAAATPNRMAAAP
jgi:hypothetical protein